MQARPRDTISDVSERAFRFARHIGAGNADHQRDEQRGREQAYDVLDQVDHCG